MPGIGNDLSVPNIPSTPPGVILPGFTFAQMQDAVRRVIQDAAGSTFPPAEIQSLLNEGALEIAMRTKILRREHTDADDPIVIAGLIPLPDDFLEAFTLHLGTEEVSLTSDDTVYNSWADSGGDAGMTIGRIFSSRIETYPAVKAGTAYKLRYAAAPAVMVNDTDVSELPVALQPKVVNFARFHCLLRDQDPKAQTYYGLFSEGLPPMPDGLEAINPGPITIQPEPGPFDVWDAGRW